MHSDIVLVVKHTVVVKDTNSDMTFAGNITREVQIGNEEVLL